MVTPPGWTEVQATAALSSPPIQFMRLKITCP
jgi:hypothetical protein